MTDIDQEEWGNSSLFTSVSEVSNEETVAFSGTISKWLKRTLYRSGPGANEINNDSSISVNHAADGCAFIQKYAIDGSSQAVRFRTSFIKYRAYKEAIKHGHLTTRQFGTDPLNNELVALTETIIGNIIHSDTLETVGLLTTLPYTQPVESEIFTATTAHVMHDDNRNMTVGYASRITPRNT
ncbi:unnamed protein product [Rotaria socialis]|uniref:Uncharacterized protein n=1 Tax=Rotaria socialis TaxID=392032 RepID=A0A820R8I8_9BILA|nr:unnamed protein product [Rotaria socialis]